MKQKKSTNLILKYLHFLWLWAFNDWKECELPAWIHPGKANFIEWFFYGANTTVRGRTFHYMIIGRYGETTQIPYPIKCYRKFQRHALWKLSE